MEYSEWIIVGLTALLVMVSALGSVATYFTLRSQIDPHVIVDAESDRDRPSLIVLVIENIGRGVAHDVRFRLAQPMPANAFGSTVDVQSFSGTDASRPPLVQIADHLKDLNKIGKALVAEVRALGVDDDA